MWIKNKIRKYHIIRLVFRDKKCMSLELFRTLFETNLTKIIVMKVMTIQELLILHTFISGGSRISQEERQSHFKGAQNYYLAKISEKLHKHKKNLAKGGVFKILLM